MRAMVEYTPIGEPMTVAESLGGVVGNPNDALRILRLWGYIETGGKRGREALYFATEQAKRWYEQEFKAQAEVGRDAPCGLGCAREEARDDEQGDVGCAVHVDEAVEKGGGSEQETLS